MKTFSRNPNIQKKQSSFLTSSLLFNTSVRSDEDEMDISGDRIAKLEKKLDTILMILETTPNIGDFSPRAPLMKRSYSTGY
jgi:hypothetical protein